MSRVFTAGNYFELPDASGLSLPIGPPGITFVLWSKFVEGNSRRGFYRYQDDGPPKTQYIARVEASEEIWTQGIDAAGFGRNTTTNNGSVIPVDEWFPQIVSYRADDDYGARVVHPYLVGPVTPVGSLCYVHGNVAPTIRIGQESGNNMRGKMAHFTIYGRGLTDDEIDDIMAGRHPLTIDGAVHYWPMTEGTGDIVDLVNGVTVPMVGTVGEDAEDNPPVDTIVLPAANLAVTITGLPSDTLLYGWLAQWV